MGADFYQIQEKCPTCGHEEDQESIGITYNLSPMWYAMYPEDKNILPIDGMTGAEADSKLLAAIKKMVDDQHRLQQFNPSNGHGSYDSLLAGLRRIRQLSQEKPDLKWEVWR